ncbi:MAG: hypothetical protein ACI8V2_005380 [Candidatus Latescibacterota bacterium]|jgi:hypothetical protein
MVSFIIRSFWIMGLAGILVLPLVLLMKSGVLRVM